MKMNDLQEYNLAVHSWLRAKHGKANKCENKKCNHKSECYDWALIKGKEYDFKRSNFKMLCRSCHKLYDITEESKLKMSESRKEYCKNNKDLISGENGSMFGKENKWGKHTEESKLKMSENNYNRGKHLPKEYRKKISESNKGKHDHTGKNNPMYGIKHTEESKKKISENCNNSGKDNPMCGKENRWGKHTEESKLKMSFARKKYWNKLKSSNK